MVIPELLTRAVPIPVSWRVETVFPVAPALPPFPPLLALPPVPPPELGVLSPDEPQAATTTAAATMPETAAPSLSIRRDRRDFRLACDEPRAGRAGRYMPAMRRLLLVL